MPEWSLIPQRSGNYHSSPGARGSFKRSSGEGLIQALPCRKEVISSNDVLNEKEKLALEDLLPFALEKVKKRKEKKTWKATFSSNLEKMIKMIELNSSIQYELH